MLTTPPVALRPYSVPCGPRSTSTRFTSRYSCSNRRFRINGVLLKLTATAGSLLAEIALVPTPRIEKLYMEKLALEKLTFGIARINSDPPSIFMASRFSADSAVTAIGTS